VFDVGNIDSLGMKLGNMVIDGRRLGWVDGDVEMDGRGLGMYVGTKDILGVTVGDFVGNFVGVIVGLRVGWEVVTVTGASARVVGADVMGLSVTIAKDVVGEEDVTTSPGNGNEIAIVIGAGEGSSLMSRKSSKPWAKNVVNANIPRI